MMVRILGVDPGVSGALAEYTFDPSGTAEEMVCRDMPTYSLKGKTRLDLFQLASIVRGFEADLVVIEEVAAMPKQGVSSTFTFGYAAGVVAGAAAACERPLEFVRPAKWKRAMGLTSDKDLSRQKASHRWPFCAEQWSRKKDDGRAEAALLALYGRQTWLPVQVDQKIG